MAERRWQSHNNELIACIEELRKSRDENQRQIAEDDAQRQQLQEELQSVTKRLHQLNDSLAKKMAAKAEFDKVIEETEAAYGKILDSSQTLLEVLKRESNLMYKKQQTFQQNGVSPSSTAGPKNSERPMDFTRDHMSDWFVASQPS